MFTSSTKYDIARLSSDNLGSSMNARISFFYQVYMIHRPRIFTQPTHLKFFTIFLKSNHERIRPKFVYHQIQCDSLNLLRCLHPFFICLEKNLLLGIQPIHGQVSHFNRANKSYKNTEQRLLELGL